MTEPTKEPMDWTDPVESDHGDGFQIIPDGTYRFVVKDFQRGRHQQKPGGSIPSCNKATLTLTIFDDAGNRLGEVTENLFLVRSLEWKIAAFFRSIGRKKHGEKIVPEWNAVRGAQGMVEIYVDTWHKREDPPGVDTGKSNKVKAFIDADEPQVPKDKDGKDLF